MRQRVGGMRRWVWLVTLVCAAAQAADEDADWVLATTLWGDTRYQLLHLQQHDGRLAGSLEGATVAGTRHGRRFELSARDDSGVARYAGTFDGARMQGHADLPDPNTPSLRGDHVFSAWRVPPRPPGGPRRREVAPGEGSNLFSQHRAPLALLYPGDTVHTSTLDSGGKDAQGRTRALYGNPQVGPFFVAGAESGDVLAVHLLRLRPNRADADSLDALVGRAQTLGLAPRAASLGAPRRWTLDLARGVARPDPASPRLAGLEVPLRPMLGGIALAPGFGMAPMSTGDSARFGGNIDYNGVVEGSTVYLPVQQPGALLYLGDAHALQGDGETSQFALETSMDVEFAVELIKQRPLATPRIASPTRLAALGQAGSLDEAVRQATAGLVQWLEQDYQLSLSDAAQLLGCCVEYRIATLAGRNAGVAASLDRAVLAPLAAASEAPAH